ncbi:MAG: nitrogenase component 1 [Lachnospiraceae bacterium]|nr:nitrogenase component 1 [Lachnospiraceae bacterium]
MNYLDPYKSCFLFGALRYFANIEGAVCLVNGPSGCTYFNRSAVLNMNGYFNSPGPVHTPRIYCIDFNERDVIFGAQKKLIAASEEIIEHFSPSVLFIFNCCVSEIIGEDIDDTADIIANKYNIPVIPVHSAGFKGDHRYGMKLAGSILVDQFMKKKTKTEPMKINLLGELDYFNRAMHEVTDYLKKAGVEDITYIPGACSLDQISDAPNAYLNIITCQNASRYLAEEMKKRFDVPYIGKASDFYGIENCYNVYSSIFDFLRIDKAQIEQDHTYACEKIKPLRKALKGTTAFVIAGTRRALGYSAILSELGVKIDFLFSECDGEYINRDNFLKYSSNIMCNEYPDDLAEKIRELNPDFVLSTLPELIAPEQSLRRPLTDFAGFSGAVEMGRYLLNVKKYGYSTAYALISKR